MDALGTAQALLGRIKRHGGIYAFDLSRSSDLVHDGKTHNGFRHGLLFDAGYCAHTEGVVPHVDKFGNNDELVAGDNFTAEARALDPGEIRQFSAVIVVLAEDNDGTDLRHRFDD